MKKLAKANRYFAPSGVLSFHRVADRKKKVRFYELRHWYRGIGVLLGLLVVSCAGIQTQTIRPTYTLDSVSFAREKKYPALFCTPPQQTIVGVSFVGQGYAVTDYTQAQDRALRQLAWGKRVRIQGEHLSQQTLGGFEPRGQKIDLLEVPAVALEMCRADTLLVDGRVWISTRFQNIPGGYSWGAWGYFISDPPVWIDDMPRNANWHYATGTAKVPFKDEAGSWELATYRALIKLAVNVGWKTRHSDQVVNQMIEGTDILSVDTRLEGFRVAARWRDDENLYVLVRVHRARAVSLLEDL